MYYNLPGQLLINDIFYDIDATDILCFQRDIDGLV